MTNLGYMEVPPVAPVKQPECIGTGFDLFDPVQQRAIHGDLFVFDGTFIFNAKGCGWQWVNPLLHASAKVVTAPSFFEKNSIIVFRAHLSLLSPAARVYIGGEWA